MTGTAFLLLTLAGAAAVGDWIAVIRGNKRLEYLCKPLTVLVLIGVALALDPHDATVRSWFVVALAFSLVGDVFLMLPRASSHDASADPVSGDRPSSGSLMGGLAAFLVAHVAYIAGLFVDGVTAQRVLVGVAVVSAAMAIVGTRIVRGAYRAEPAMVGPVSLYMAVISTMLVAAIGTGRAAAIIGAGLFYVSDALIGWSRFARPKPASRAIGQDVGQGCGQGDAHVDVRGASQARDPSRTPLAIIVTYHLGQMGLVLSLASSGIWSFALLMGVLALVLVSLLELS